MNVYLFIRLCSYALNCQDWVQALIKNIQIKMKPSSICILIQITVGCTETALCACEANNPSNFGLDVRSARLQPLLS